MLLPDHSALIALCLRILQQLSSEEPELGLSAEQLPGLARRISLHSRWSPPFVLMSLLHRRAHRARRDSLVFSACSALSAVESRSKLASTRLG